jgi:hypothetical protein
VWFNIELKCADLTTGTWELFIDGVSQGTATIASGNAVGGVNLYAAAGNNYYVDDISLYAVASDACTSDRTAATVHVDPCITTSNITFQVDMSQVTDPFTTPELNGTFNGWCGNCNAMSDADGDNVWDVTVALNVGDTIEYKYSADSWTIQEMNDPNAPCTNGDPTYTNRVYVVPSSDATIGEVCWGSCDPCSNGINNGLADMMIYPNPADQIINISSRDQISKVVVKDVLGKEILHISTSTNFYQLDVSKLASNIYYVETWNGTKWFKERIMVTH